MAFLLHPCGGPPFVGIAARLFVPSTLVQSGTSRRSVRSPFGPCSVRDQQELGRAMRGPLLPRVTHGAILSDGKGAAAFLSQSLPHYSAAAARPRIEKIPQCTAAG